MENTQFLEQLAKRLVDEGKLIEAGWVSLRLHALPMNAPSVQLTQLRMAFMAGAHHLLASVIGIHDPEPKETQEEDIRRMDLICEELKGFGKELTLMASKAAGNG